MKTLAKIVMVRILILSVFLIGTVHAASMDDASRSYLEGKSEKALLLYRDLWAQEKIPEALLNSALIENEMGNPLESILLLEEARTKNKSPDLSVELAWLYANVGQWEKCDALLRRIKPPPVDNPYFDLLKARYFLSQKDFDSAQKILNGLTEKSPKFTLGHYYLGKLYEAKGDGAAAIPMYQRVLKEDSHFVEVRPFLGRLFEKENQIDDAWRQYSRTSSADDNNKTAIAGMRRLARLITKKPAEIVAPKKIVTHTDVMPIINIKNLPKIKVGIGSNNGGEPTKKLEFVFRTSKSFVVFDPETNKDLRSGPAHSLVKVRWNPSKYVAEIVLSDGRILGRFSRTIGIRQKSVGPTTTILNSLAFAPNTTWGGFADKEIRGDIEVRMNHKKKTLVIINHLSIEEYVLGVLAAEMPIHWPVEALKAQAVIARTQGLYRKGLHKKFGYDVCDEQHCQVYTGVSVESKKAFEAVDGTRGEYISFNGRPAHTVFSSNCGGITQSGIQAGWGDVPYWRSEFEGKAGTARPESLSDVRKWLQQTPAAFCESSNYTWNPEFRWTRIVMAEDLNAKINQKYKIGKLKSLQVLSRNASGRVQKLKFIGTKKSVVISKEHLIRKYMGLGSVRSTFFVVDPVFVDEKLDSFIVIGGGWGHAVGFCQSGSAGLADDGEGYVEIINHYFPRTTLKKI